MRDRGRGSEREREREREGRGEMRRTKMGQTNKGKEGTERQTSRIETGMVLGEDVSFPE